MGFPIFIITRFTVVETTPCFYTFFISGSIFAGTLTNTVRTSSGQLISIGDSFADMNTRIAQSPISMQTYEKKKAKLPLLFLIILMKLN